MYLAQRPQRNDAGESRTRCPSVSSQALYPWAYALPVPNNGVFQMYYVRLDIVLVNLKRLCIKQCEAISDCS